MSDFLNKLIQNFDTFTNSQKTIANYLMENLDTVAFNTLEDISSKVGVSTTTVIRFTRALGYNGYSELQKDIQGGIKNKVSLPNRLNEEVNIPKDQLLYDSFENDMKNIQKTLSSLSEDALLNTIQTISSARNVYILGMRGSFSLAHYMFSRLGQIRRNIRLIQSVGITYPEELIGAAEGDVCIAYFFPRYSKASATILSWLKRKGVKIILFTSLNHHAVREFGDVFLPCAISGISFKNSYAAPICLTNYIAAAMVGNDYERSKEVLEDMEDLLSQGYYLGL
ncbi:MurR/RpiR family transcriptional regulator [Wukongibacter baidiensis]|uniref:MurR/RpiR family transcriptional regulator n=1 Tax=Wukongibacter baidiensis TaxID=1723361 RepID=UPI003D7F5E29